MGTCKKDGYGSDWYRMRGHPSQRQNFKLSWLPPLVVMKRLELFIAGWLEKRVNSFITGIYKNKGYGSVMGSPTTPLYTTPGS